ncbi:MAG: nucleotidyltransferase family protein [Bryobacterales bacterium]|nr:nucleotidyltransferase family protein [Bryobacterales bacterium]
MQACAEGIPFDVLAPAPRNPGALLAWIDRHCLAGLVATSPSHLPAGEAFVTALHARARQSTLRALRHAAATVRTVQSLAATGIDAIPLKGAVLADQLYGDPAIRDVRDADLLIRPYHLLEADSLLLASGFAREWPTRLPPPESRTFRRLLRDGYHFEYKHPTEKVNVEVHWRLPGWSSAAVEAIWEASEVRSWRGVPVRQLANDSLLLLLLCDHGAQHRWFRLKWLVDVAVLLPRVSDCRGLLALAEQLDLERPLGQAAALCTRIFGSPVPDELRALADRRECQWLTAEALESIAAPAEHYFSPRRSICQRLRRKQYHSRLRTRSTPWRLPLWPFLWLHETFAI